MSNSYNYNPVPPRVWSRVQNPCTYIDDSNNSNYSPVYIPITNQTVSLAQANYEEKLFYKGNVLQYKGNSSRLTKKQKYTQLAKGFGPNRTKVFATQSQTYTNPNTTGLLRVNYTTYPYPNQIVGAPNNPSGPFQYNVPNPFDCSNNYIQDGGNLVCGTYANPCTGEIIQSSITSSTICNPSYCSDVPGTPVELCWNPNIQSWFPRQRYFMNNSGTKWPVNYKGLVSAVTPVAPVLTLDSYTPTTVTLSWSNNTNLCIPISSYNIYQNGVLVQTQPYTITSSSINGLTSGTNYSYYITSVSNSIESAPSNIVTISTQPLYNATGYSTVFNSFYSGIVFEYSTNPQSITFNYSINNINVLVVAGGGGAGQTASPNNPGGGGGGGGGIYYSSNFVSQVGQYNIVVGKGGNGTSITPQYQAGGDSTISFGGNPLISVTGGGESGQNASSTGGTSGGPGGGNGYFFGGAGATGIYDTTWTQGKVYANGQDSGLSSITIPTSPSTLLYLSGGGGGAVNDTYTNTNLNPPNPPPNGPGGTAGSGFGGVTGDNTAPSGVSGINSFTNNGGFGGGGGGTAGYGNPSDQSGNGGGGVIIFWWQTI